jgi:hypothetical protein
MCSTLRPADATVHDEARGAGARYAASALCGRLPSSPSGKHRWRAPEAHPSAQGARGGRGARRVGGGSEAACCLHLRLRLLVLLELPYIFRPLLRRHPARARLCGGRQRGAEQRYPSSAWMATSAPRMSSSAIVSDMPFNAA